MWKCRCGLYVSELNNQCPQCGTMRYRKLYGGI